MKVFIVDDSKIVRDRLVILVSDLKKIEVIGQAKSTRQAIVAIRKLKPDVVILDIRMRDGNGIEVLANIKKNKSSPVIIMLTNYPYPQYRKKCLDAGADFFFDKSTEFERVIEVCQDLIAKPLKANSL